VTLDFAFIRGFLTEFCDFLLPGNPSRGLPTFSDLGIIEKYLENSDSKLLLNAMGVNYEIVQSTFGSKNLSLNELERLFSHIVAKPGPELILILGDLLSLYYTNQVIITALDLNKSLPFPKGIRLNEIDFDLLIPVVAQGIKYKQVGGNECEIQ
jgi:hypothetical protein